MTDSNQHSRVWFSPHGTEWEAETYEEALEMERDSLVEQLEAARWQVEALGGHNFIGRLDRDCDRCGKPDRHPLHGTMMRPSNPAKERL